MIAAKPCDAAALPILDHVFNWDFEDGFYTARRARTTVVTLACAAPDDACFCTSVGSGPADETGSDAMLFELGDGQFEVRAITEKGRALFAGDGTLPHGRGSKWRPVEVRRARVARYLTGQFREPAVDRT